jgi:L-asparaginase II
MNPLVVEVLRGGLVESRHSVDAAVADADGRLIASAGEPETVAYLRSCAKPVQATACMELGWKPPGERELAVACASHNGEEIHVEAVRSILRAAGLDERALIRLPATTPSIVGTMPPPDARGPVLATVVANGWDPDGYQAADHPLQSAVRRRVEELMGAPSRAIAGDGCRVPTFAFALSEMARGFSRLPAAAPRAVEAMRAHPSMVAGSNRICTSVMAAAPGVVLKVGAEGLICGALIHDGRGFALKARDGSARGREPATLHVLLALGAIAPALREDVMSDIAPRILPGHGLQPYFLVRGELTGS